MQIAVTNVSIPAMSTIGYGTGTLVEDDLRAGGTIPAGTRVTFVGDHRPMRDLGEALRYADEPPVADVEGYQIVGGPDA